MFLFYALFSIILSIAFAYSKVFVYICSVYMQFICSMQIYAVFMQYADICSIYAVYMKVLEYFPFQKNAKNDK